MADTKNPSSQVYWNDLENDEKLRACSLAAKGLWVCHLLPIAARSPEPGIVQIGSFDMSPPHGLTHIASAVGQPLDVIKPLIDELLTSGAASRDRKGRIYNRRMVKRAKLSLVRSKAGKKGYEASHGKINIIPPEPGKPPGKHPPPSGLQDFDFSSQGFTPVSAPSASASPDGPPRSALPDSAKWAERLAGYRPWEGKRTWQPFWGPRPDSLQRNAALEHDAPQLLKAWLEEYRAAKARGECS
jgi:hypothetical protein